MPKFTYPDLSNSDVDEYRRNYLRTLRPEANLLEAYGAQMTTLMDTVRKIHSQRGNTAYEEGKWTLFELFIHLIDWERIMACRLLLLARKSETNIMSLEQDPMITMAVPNARSLDSLNDEWSSCRQATIALLTHLPEEALGYSGKVSSYKISVNDLGYLNLGHVAHHEAILRERYLS